MVRSQATLFGQQQQQQQQRRFSYGWTSTSNTSTMATIPSSPSVIDGHASYERFTNDKSRLTTSHSYSDLHAAARSYTTASQHPYNVHPHHNQHHRSFPYDITDAKDVIPCPQYVQHGMCPLDDQCPYSHSPTSTSTSMAFNHFIPSSPHPLSNYQQYPQPYPTFHPNPLLGFASNNNLIYDPNSSFFPPSSKLMPRYVSTPTSTITNTSSSSSSSSATGNPALLETNYGASYGHGMFLDNKATMTGDMMSDISQQQQQQHRRSIADPEANRFLGAKLEDFQGKLYDLCKDHNGCRFLQKKLEDPNGQHLQTIFDEIHPHFVELMTGKPKENRDPRYLTAASIW
jgi:hypothetical protein